jgi:parvulin-like peptidyl-prolyl isomerase
VNTKAEADKLYAQLQKNPKQFAALAKKYSKDTGSAAQGGELGFFGPGQMVPPFEKAAYSQPIGVIGKPVKSQYGYHIILVEARKKVPFAQLDQTTQQTYQQKQQTAFTNWLTQERKALHVKILAKGVTVQ